jgi:hypothetical protein
VVGKWATEFGLKSCAAVWRNICKTLALTRLCLQRQSEERRRTDAEQRMFCYQVSSFVTVFKPRFNHFQYSQRNRALSVLCDTVSPESNRHLLYLEHVTGQQTSAQSDVTLR